MSLSNPVIDIRELNCLGSCVDGDGDICDVFDDDEVPEPVIITTFQDGNTRVSCKYVPNGQLCMADEDPACRRACPYSH